MKFITVCLLVFSFALLLPKDIQATNQCNYHSTQARVQKNQEQPWSRRIYLNCGESFHVGSFHNQTGQFAPDTTVQVSDPNGNMNTYHNGAKVATQLELQGTTI